MLGKGAMASFSKKQKLNARISIKADLIGADDALSYILCPKYFIESQSYTTDYFILYQYKTSKMY